MLLVWGAFRLMATVLIRAIVIVRCKGCGIWVMTALWGTLVQLAISPFSWMDAAMEGVGERVGQMMETEADREPEEERAQAEGPQHGRSQEEVLLVAKRQRQGRAARCPHRHGSRGRRRYSPARHQEYQAVVIDESASRRGVYWIL
jgi:hypothetical protein